MLVNQSPPSSSPVPSPPFASRPHSRISQHLISLLPIPLSQPRLFRPSPSRCWIQSLEGLPPPVSIHPVEPTSAHDPGPRFSRTFGEATCNCICTPLACNTIHPRLSLSVNHHSLHSDCLSAVLRRLPGSLPCLRRHWRHTHSRAGPSNGKSAPAVSRPETELVTPRHTTPHTQGNAYSCNAYAAP